MLVLLAPSVVEVSEVEVVVAPSYVLLVVDDVVALVVVVVSDTGDPQPYIIYDIAMAAAKIKRPIIFLFICFPLSFLKITLMIQQVAISNKNKLLARELADYFLNLQHHKQA